MKNSRMGNKESKNATANKGDRTVEVLYQKMGDRWFAFSLIDDEVFFGSIPQSEINATRRKKSQSKKLAGNS